MLDKNSAAECKRRLDGTTEVLVGQEALEEIVQRDDVDVVISALVGFAGLKPTIAAIKAKKKIALANKETLVVAGEIIMPLVKETGSLLIPVDSEHSAIFQCLVGESGSIRRQNYSHCIGRTVSQHAKGDAEKGIGRASPPPSKLEDGKQSHDRFRNVDEQRPGGD